MPVAAPKAVAAIAPAEVLAGVPGAVGRRTRPCLYLAAQAGPRDVDHDLRARLGYSARDGVDA
jgi:hypothetical protein